MKNEPIRHHYIPQFILRNFCFDKDNNLYYHDNNTGKTSIKNTRDVFMVENLYRDEINNPDQKTKIESDLAKYECEVAKIINEKFLKNDDISITIEEDEKLKLFFAIMEFRGYHTSLMFGDSITDESRDFYKHYQNDENFNDFWKRNLGRIVTHRSIKEVLDDDSIDDPIKKFMRRDTQYLFGKYFVVAEKRGHLDFVIGDAYPTVVQGIIDDKIKLNMYELYPISPNRIIIFASNGVEKAPKVATRLKPELFKKPKLNRETNEIIIHVKKVYEEDVKYINGEIIDTSSMGYASLNMI